jgi:hypothetical protein
MRTLSSTALQAMFAEETGQAYLVLITISHPKLALPLTLTSDAVATVSNSGVVGGPNITFIPCPFQFSIPDDQSDQLPVANLSLDNIDLAVINAVRSLGNVPATVLMQVVMASTPNTIEAQWTMTMRNVEYDAFTVSADLRFDELLDEPFPGDLVTPATLPGVFLIGV